MKIAFFDAHRYERRVFDEVNSSGRHSIVYFDARLTAQTAALAKGYDAICIFVNDRLDAETLSALATEGIRLIALRCAGFNQVDLVAAARLGLRVVRVPEYSPYAVAEHAVALLMTLNRKTHRAYSRVRELNFSLDGLMGFDLHGKTAGVVGTGRIGAAFARIMSGFGCKVVAFDPKPDQDLIRAIGLQYMSFDELLMTSDLISLHLPLLPATHHLIDENALGKMKAGAILINTGRGGLVDTSALIQALKSHHIGGACLDVYEEEEGIFFSDFSADGIEDDTLARLVTFPNVIITSHQAFLTNEALTNIAQTTLDNVSAFELGQPLVNEVKLESK